ncbi:DNA repair protein RecN [Myroides odoratus]|uniref:DNA repair protein RecN n=1 Tax=Myroides odoratus TaxID=256 RepID=A0A9Q7E830_MYROD|nr:DNA repair protein RecN [Myroides odoratus]EHQ41807.1 DNA replication and repair protein RecN [Myroides odoratus DSM 2801]EKB08963.1 DNA repair protein RecN [Myroides odoratus CIP 103059]QQT99207.1 DNA repair protein RecN [Myroides odoratus]WQD58595.1 DNA repair protein RecN [Myroides odoratus]STZ29069.1 Recombination protein N [Myroides odoratus]
MLTSLSIKNFALIDHLEIEFFKGFSIITGETGAGKSIVLGALGLLQGKRADLGSLKNKDEKCVIEGQFKVDPYKLEELYSFLDMDYEPITIIRREILPSGKSRAFVNDSPVNLTDLQELSAVLLDIHSQHQTSELSEETYQIKVIDAIAKNEETLEEYQKQLKLYKTSVSELKQLKEEEIELLKEQDYNAFLLEELEALQLTTIDQVELESEFEKLNNVEHVRESFAQATQILTTDQMGVIQGLKELRQTLQKTATVSKDYEELYNRVVSAEIELADLANEIEREVDHVVSDPERLTVLHERLQVLYALQKKHQVNSVEELIAIETGLNDKVFKVGEVQHKIVAVEQQIEALLVKLDQLADQLSQARQQAIPALSDQLVEILTLVGMPHATFQFDFKTVDQYLTNGKDQMQLQFSANKGMDYGLLKKVASGGELSRIMLAIKAILARYSNLPTIIFDEIDTGVSGEVADKMGVIMKDMSTLMQVFAITHLPQIAAKGHQHYKVFKASEGESTTSKLIQLDQEHRVEEIAQMLSGKDITASALQHAKELLNG